LLLRVWAIDRFAKFTAVNLGIFANSGCNVGRVIEPALQMTGTELAFLVFFVTGTLLGFASLEFRRCGFPFRACG
jgi:hypothetical protein